MINKRGSLLDVAFVAIMLFFTATVILFGYKITASLNDKVQDSSIVDSYGKQSFNTLEGYYPTVLDSSFLFITIGVVIATIAMAALVRVHPIFIIFYIIGWVMIIILSGVFSNVYETMAENGQLSGVSTNLTIINTIMTYLPIIVGVLGTIIAIVMYKTWRDG